MIRSISPLLALIFLWGQPQFAAAELIDIDNHKLKALIAEGVPVIDLRRADEWTRTGVIDGSHLMTFFDKAGRYDAEKWKSVLDSKVSMDKPVILICHSGVRTSIVGKWLSGQMDTVYNVEKGIASWLKSGNETVPAKDKP